MKKAANILLLVGAILAILGALVFIIYGLLFIVVGSNEQLLLQLLNEGQIQNPFPERFTNAELAHLVAGASMGIGTVCAVVGLCGIPSAIFGFKARNSSNKALFILNIVFGILSCSLVNAVGGVFGLIKGDTIPEANNGN